MTWYTVYDARSDEVLAIGTGRECAQVLGVTSSAFYCSLSRMNAGRKCYLTILAEELDDEGNVVSAQVYENPSERRGPPLSFDEAAALRLYWQGKSDGDIAKAVGTSYCVVSQWRQRRGLPSNIKKGRPRRVEA